MLSFESEREIKEHISSLLDVSDPKVNQFKEQFIKRWKYLQTNCDENPAVYKKMEINNTGTKKKTQNKVTVVSYRYCFFILLDFLTFLVFIFHSISLVTDPLKEPSN